MVFLFLSSSRFLYERHEQSKQDLKGLEETVVSDFPSAPSQWGGGEGWLQCPTLPLISSAPYFSRLSGK